MSADVPGLAQQIAHFEDRLRHDPGSRAFLALADLYRRSGRLILARDLLRQGLERHPGFMSARVTLALTLADLGDHAPARVEMEAVLADDPDNLAALRFLAADAAAQDSHDLARRHAERLIRLAPDDRQARSLLSPTVDPERVPPVPAARPSGPADPTGFVTPTLAELYLRQGHHDKAREICRRILAADPDRQDARRLLDQIDSQADPPPSPPAEAQANGRPRRPLGGSAGDIDRFQNWLDAAGGDQRDPAN